MSAFFVFFWVVQSSLAFCPNPPKRIRTLFTRADVVFIGTVVSSRGEDENGKEILGEGNPKALGAAIVYYRVKTTQIFLGPKAEFVEVCENNDSGRMGIQIGHTYLFLLEEDYKKRFFGYCGNAFDSLKKDYETKISDVKEVMKNIEKGKDGDVLGFVGTTENTGSDGLGEFHLLVTCLSGKKIVKKVVTDMNGWFDVQLPQGNYKIESLEPNYDLKATVYCPDPPNGFEVLTAGGAELGLVAEPK